MADVASAIAQYEQLKQGRYGWENMWQQIADNMVGRRDFSTMRTPGDRRMGDIHDITALLSAELLAGALHSLMTNSASKWFRLGIENPQLAQHPDVRLWIDEIAEPQMYNAINRPEAGFNPQMHEVYFNLTAFCTAGVAIEEDVGRGAVFSSRPLMEVFIEGTEPSETAVPPGMVSPEGFLMDQLADRDAGTAGAPKAPKPAP